MMTVLLEFIQSALLSPLNYSCPEYTGQAEHPEPWGNGVVGTDTYEARRMLEERVLLALLSCYPMTSILSEKNSIIIILVLIILNSWWAKSGSYGCLFIEWDMREMRVKLSKANYLGIIFLNFIYTSRNGLMRSTHVMSWYLSILAIC